jgi:hypothetical protein
MMMMMMMMMMMFRSLTMTNDLIRLTPLPQVRLLLIRGVHGGKAGQAEPGFTRLFARRWNRHGTGSPHRGGVHHPVQPLHGRALLPVHPLRVLARTRYDGVIIIIIIIIVIIMITMTTTIILTTNLILISAPLLPRHGDIAVTDPSRGARHAYSLEEGPGAAYIHPWMTLRKAHVRNLPSRPLGMAILQRQIRPEVHGTPTLITADLVLHT